MLRLETVIQGLGFLDTGLEQYHEFLASNPGTDFSLVISKRVKTPKFLCFNVAKQEREFLIFSHQSVRK